MNDRLTSALTELGLTGLEAEIYAQLLASSPLTGYAIARQIGKPTANTYKALESLHDKGAVLMEYGKTRLYRAVSAADLLASLERRHRAVGAELITAAAKLPRNESDDRVYQVGSADQLFQQYRRMLENATRVAVFDLFPQAVTLLKEDLQRAAKRKIRTVVKVYAPITIPGVELIMHTNPTTLSRWPGEWANGVVDGVSYQVAFLSRDCRTVHLAVRSDSPYLAWMYHHGLVSELMDTSVEAALKAKKSISAIQTAHNKYRDLLTDEAPGLTLLMKRFADSQE